MVFVFESVFQETENSCPPLRRDNPRALDLFDRLPAASEGSMKLQGIKVV